VYSKANLAVTAFRIGTGFDISPVPVSVADPVLLALPRGDPTGHEQLAVDFIFRNLQIRRTLDALVNPQEMTLFKVFVQGSDLQITEALFQCTDPELMTTFDIPYSMAIRLPAARTLNQKSRKYAEIDEVDDFTVEDGHQDDFNNQEMLQDRLSQVSKELLNAQSGTSVCWENIYDLVTSGHGSPLSNRRLDFSQNLRSVQRSARRLRGSEMPSQLFLEAAKECVYIPDVEDASAEFSSFLEGLLVEVAGNVSLINVRVSNQNVNQLPTLLERYNNIFAAWVSSLPPPIPDRIRVNRERLARGVAVDLTLGGTVLRRSFPLSTSTQDRSPQPEPGFLHSGFGECEAAPSQLTSSQASTPRKDLCLSRLRIHTTLTKPAATIPGSTAQTDILAHSPTDISTSPMTYSWRSTELSLAAARDSRAAAQLDPKARRRAEKRTELQQRKIDSQKMMSQALMEERAKGVPMVVDSQKQIQMQMPVRQVQSSQLAPPESSQSQLIWPTVSMTQPERGAFGTHTRTGMVKQKGKGKGKEVRRAGF
jgi:RNA polymerase I-specific transcription-initiation factor